MPVQSLLPVDDVIRSSSFSNSSALAPARRQTGTGALGFATPFGLPPGLFPSVYGGGCSQGQRGRGGHSSSSCGGGGGARLDFNYEELGHFSDDCSYQSALPRRSCGQSDDVKLLRQPALAAEFRPLGHYPHLSRRQAPVRPTHLPLQASAAAVCPERPASACSLRGGGGGPGSRAELSHSDSDSETVVCPLYCQAALAGPLARMRISSGSLQLEEEEEEEGTVNPKGAEEAGATAKRNP